jgi:anti-sigma factor RsiW
MNCKEVKEKLLFYLDDELDGKERQAVERHLTTCAYCREELEALSETQSILKRSFESISSRNAPVWAWAELESRLAMTDNISPPLLVRVVSKFKVSLWEGRWKRSHNGCLTIVLIVTSAFCISNAFSPQCRA